MKIFHIFEEYQFSNTFERTGLVDTPLKPDAVKDLDILLVLCIPFNKGMV